MQVPYEPYSTVNPQAPDTPQIKLYVNPAMFGANVGAAMERLGTSGEEVGNELFTRAMALQQINNENKARAAQTDYATQSSILHAQFGSQLGTNANPQALADYIQKQKDLREKIRGTLQTADAQLYYDRDTLPFMQRNIFSAAGHAEDQTKQTALKTSQAQLDMFTQQGWTDAPGEFEERVRGIDGPIANIATIAGMTKPEADELRMKTINAMSMHQIEYQAFNDPQAALQMLEDNQKLDKTDPRRMGVDAYEKTLEFVQGRNRVVGSNKLANDIYSPDKSIDEMIKEANTRAADYAHGDPMFAPATERSLRQLVSQNKAFEASDNADTRNMLTNKVLENPKITTAQLLSDPELANRVQRLPPAERASVVGGLWLDKTKNQVTFDQQRRAFNGLYGLATSGDQDDREKFMEADLSQQGLRPELVRQLQALKHRIMKDQQDPHIGPALRAMMDFRPIELRALNLVPGESDYDKDAALQYRGAMAIAIDAWRQDHKGQPPSYKDVTEIIGPSVIGDVPYTGGSWLHQLFGASSHPAFQPEEDEIQAWATQTGIVDKVIEKTGSAPSTDEIRRAYLRQQMMEEWEHQRKIQAQPERGMLGSFWHYFSGEQD